MAEKTGHQDAEALKAKILGETAKIAWVELQRFFASGSAIAVAPDLDLVEVALQVSVDNETVVNDWVSAGKFGKVSDEQAAEWHEANALMWAVVIRPWVLVQPVKAD